MPEASRKPRELVTVRLNPGGIEKVDELAAKEDRTRSDMIRILVAEALAARGIHGEGQKPRKAGK